MARLPPTSIILNGQIRQSNGLSSPSIHPVSVSAGQVNNSFSSSSLTLKMNPPSLEMNSVSGFSAQISLHISSVNTGVSQRSYLSKTQHSLHLAQLSLFSIFFSNVFSSSVVYEFSNDESWTLFNFSVYLPYILTYYSQCEYLYSSDEPDRAHSA